MTNTTTDGTVVLESINFVSDLFRPLFTKFVVSVIIILTGLILGRILGKLIQRVLSELEIDANVKKIFGLSTKLEEIIGLAITYIIYFIAFTMAIANLGLHTYVVYVISSAALILILISMFLGIKDFMPNVISGMLIRRKGVLKEGDFVQYDTIKGEIIKMSIVDTRIKTATGDIIYIPNSLLAKSEIKKIKKV